METTPFTTNSANQTNNFYLSYSSTPCSKILAKIFQLFLWIALILTFLDNSFFAILIILYFLYLIVEFTSNNSFYLFNKKSTSKLYDRLKVIFKTQPTLNISCQCYHYENSLVEQKDEKGNKKLVNQRKRYTTYNGSQNFQYYSSRDISGLFFFDTNDEIFRNKVYLKLNINTEVRFYDPVSFSDYQIFKNNFLTQNRCRDQQMDFKENFYVPNLHKNNLISLRNEEPAYINFFVFLLFVLIGIGEVFQYYLDNLSVEGNYKIKKIVSTRYDLNSEECSRIFINDIPAIKLGDKEFNFQKEDYGYKNNNATVNYPTLEEIEAASKYQENIRNYQPHGENQNYVNSDAPPAMGYPTDSGNYYNKKIM